MNTEVLPQVVDHASFKIAKLVFASDWERAMENRAHELDRFILRSVARPNSRFIEGLAASTYIETCVGVLEQEIFRVHGEYSAARWLWYLRRLPRQVFSGKFLTTLGYDRSLAESLSWSFIDTHPKLSGNAVVFPINESTVRHALRFSGGVRFLSHFHSLYRRAGKGSSFLIPSNSAIPKTQEEKVIQSAILDYDTRHEQCQDFGFSGLGLSDVTADAEKLNLSSFFQHYTLVTPCEDTQVRVRIPNEVSGFTDAIATAKHALRLGRVDAVLRPYGGKAEQLPEWSDSFIVSLCVLMLFHVFVIKARWCLPSVMQVGYFAWSRTNVMMVLSDWLPRLADHLVEIRPDLAWPRDGEKFLGDLFGLAPTVWPLTGGGIVKSIDDILLIDLAAATRTFIDALEVRRHASYSNARAQRFELQIEQLISDSPWRPVHNLLATRGRSLKKMVR